MGVIIDMARAVLNPVEALKEDYAASHDADLQGSLAEADRELAQGGGESSADLRARVEEAEEAQPA